MTITQSMVWDFSNWFAKLTTGQEIQQNDNHANAEDLSVENRTNWNSIPIKVIEDHFRKMTVRKSSNKAPFMSEAVFSAFIKKAFHNNTNISKQKINYVKGEKSFVIKRFYELFDLAVKEYGEINKKEKYINLIYDSLLIWEQKDQLNHFSNQIKQRKMVNTFARLV
ncbi:MAG: hypothetical protein IPM74_17040 [Crocinitomicaceae bacterium]|nr:hypothetical protein [Crocinitomicaceae bacterium]